MKWFFLAVGIGLLIYAQTAGSRINSGFVATTDGCQQVFSSDNEGYTRCLTNADKSKSQKEHLRVASYIIGGTLLISYLLSAMSTNKESHLRD